MERSKKLARQFKRYLGVEDCEHALANAAASLQAEKPEEITAEQLSILENFPKFFDSIQNSYNEYEDRLKVATRNIEISSRELTTAYANLENLNANINVMLESLGQGLLFFDRDGICSPVFSKACLSLLETDPAHRKLPDVLGFSADETRNFRSWLGIVFSNSIALDFDDMKKLLPGKKINSRNRTIELNYRPMYLNEDTLMGVLLIATDITYQLEAREKMEEIQMEAHKIYQIAQNRNGFHRFLCDLDSFIDLVKHASEHACPDDKIALLRQLHTFKGSASTFNLTRLSEYIHDIETELKNVEAGRIIATLTRHTAELQRLLEKEKDLARSLFGAGFLAQGKTLTVEISKIEEYARLIEKVATPEQSQILIQALTSEFLLFPIHSAFLSFEREVSRMAEHQGKAVPVFRLEGENIPIVFSAFEDFFNCLIHVARNIADHGLEIPEERLHKGKPREGQICVRTERIKQNGDFIRITIHDDGQGIDAEKIRHKLKRERGLDLSATSDEDVLQYIFQPEFSLRKEATMVSGRGMGMNAVFAVVQGMGGFTIVKSGGPDGQGTTFIFELPCKAQPVLG